MRENDTKRKANKEILTSGQIKALQHYNTPPSLSSLCFSFWGARRRVGTTAPDAAVLPGDRAGIWANWATRTQQLDRRRVTRCVKWSIFLLKWEKGRRLRRCRAGRSAVSSAKQRKSPRWKEWAAFWCDAKSNQSWTVGIYAEQYDKWRGRLECRSEL